MLDWAVQRPNRFPRTSVFKLYSYGQTGWAEQEDRSPSALFLGTGGQAEAPHPGRELTSGEAATIVLALGMAVAGFMQYGRISGDISDLEDSDIPVPDSLKGDQTAWLVVGAAGGLV